MTPAWEALAHKKWAELEALEHDGRVLYVDAIRKRAKGGKVEEATRIAIRVLRKPERRRAYVKGVEYCKEVGLDPANPQHKDLVDEIDTLAILAQAIRDVDPPHDQHRTIAQLEHEYDMRSLEEIWAKYKLYEDLTDPREEITDEDFWAVVLGIAKTRRIDPLAEYESHEQRAFLLRLADTALTSPDLKSFCSQFESSTRES